VASCCTLLADGGGIVANDVVGHEGVVINHATRSIAIPDNDSAFAVFKHKVVGDHHVAGGMPEMNAPSRIAVVNVGEDVAEEIGMVDSLCGGGGGGGVADVMDHIADSVVIGGVEGGIFNAGAAVAIAKRGNVVDVVADDTHERSVILDASLDVAGDVKAHDVHIVSGVDPDRAASIALQLSAPFNVRDKTDTSADGSADPAADRPVGARGDVHDRSRRHHIGRVLDCCPRSRG